jgi:rRNA maturation endonuclease Nob1
MRPSLKSLANPGGQRKTRRITCKRCKLVFYAATARREYCDECGDVVRREWRKMRKEP